MNLYTLKNKKGFTIIEVVLVLAVAGLIFLMVFLALPALQRAQRDAARKQAIANIASQIITYYSNTRHFPKEYRGSIKSKDFPLNGFQSSEIEEVKIIDSRNPIGTSTSEYYANLSGKFNSLYIGLGGVCQKERYGEKWPAYGIASGTRSSSLGSKGNGNFAILGYLETGAITSVKYYNQDKYSKLDDGKTLANYCEDFSL